MLWLILQQLKSTDAEKRRQAAERLGELQSTRALPALIRALSDKDTKVRVAAVNALAAMEDDRAFEPMLRAARDASPDVRLAVITRLKDNGSQSVQNMMVAALRDSDAIVHGRAARILEHVSWHPTDPEDEVWLAIARGYLSRAAALGSVAIRPLESILQDPSAGGMHIAAIEALGSISDERVLKSLARTLRSGDHTVCLAAIVALANAGGPDVINDLTPMLKHKDNRIRAAVIEVLSKLDPESKAGDFRELLRDPKWDVRCAAAAALAKAPDPASVDTLIAAMKDQNEDVRCAAATSLGRTKDQKAIGPLVLALKDPGTNVRKVAGASLTQIDHKWAESEAARKMVPELKSALNSSDWFVKNAAVNVLKQIGEDQPQPAVQPGAEVVTPARRRQQLVVGTFLTLLEDGDGDLRQAAALALGQLHDNSARSPLMSALSDTNHFVRRTASEALTNLGVE